MKKFIAISTFILGIWLINIGLHMSQAQVISTQSEHHNTKARNSMIGAGVGGGAGLLTWVILGGVGVATGGTGFAIGALGLTLLGTGAGALGGAATGGDTVTQIQQAHQLYSVYAWGAVLLVGAGLTFFGGQRLNALFSAWWKRRRERFAGTQPT